MKERQIKYLKNKLKANRKGYVRLYVGKLLTMRDIDILSQYFTVTVQGKYLILTKKGA